MRGPLPALTCAVVLAAGLAGCGSGESRSDRPAASASPTPSSPSYDPEKQRVADATANLTDFFSVYAPLSDRTYFSRKEAGCIARRVVRDPGIPQLQEAGVLNDELQYVIDAKPRFDRPGARAVTDALFACSRAEQVARRDAVNGLDGATPAQRTCAARKLTDDLIGFAFVLSLQGKPLGPAVMRLTRAFAPCRRL